MNSQLKNRPPGTAEKILAFFLRENERTFLLGDYQELYCDLISDKGLAAAVIWYWLQALKIIPSVLYESATWSFVMIKNYLTITLRTLKKYKGFSFINITGLSISIAICLMIIIFVTDEKSSDRFQENRDLIYRIDTGDSGIRYSYITGWATTPGNLAGRLKTNCTCIKNTVRIRQFAGMVLTGNSDVPVDGYFAEPSFFSVFSFILKSGNPLTSLSDPFSVVLTESAATKFFGTADPVGKTLSLETYGDFKVTGIVHDLKQKSHIRFEALFSFPTIFSLFQQGKIENSPDTWETYSEYYTYVLLDKTSGIDQVRENLPAIAKEIVPPEKQDQYSFFVQPLLEINLGMNLINSTPGTKHTTDIFIIPFIALIIILLASFNYVNLSIARSIKRTREIGLRKVLGSTKGQIFKLFLSEAFVLTFISLVLACILILWLIPLYNSLPFIQKTETQINISLLKDIRIYIIFGIFGAAVSFITGIYPALYLSSFIPVNALKGTRNVKSGLKFRLKKILIGLQFTVSIVAIIIIVFLYHQFVFMYNADLGINTDNTVSVNLQGIDHNAVVNEIHSNALVKNTAHSSLIPVYSAWSYAYGRKNMQDDKMLVAYHAADNEFIDFYGIELIAGNLFPETGNTDANPLIIINEKAIATFGLQSPAGAIGKTVILGDNKVCTISGVIRDFHYKNLTHEIEPEVIINAPERMQYLHIRYPEGKREEMRSYLRNVWQKFDKIHPLDAKFNYDLENEEKSSINQVLGIAAYGSGFVILISLMGLLGMTSYSMEFRIREIGIRKVFGAETAGIITMLSKDFMSVVFIAGIIAAPVSWILCKMFLRMYAYKAPLHFAIFAGGIAFVLILALLTVVSQTMKAASLNPVATIREE